VKDDAIGENGVPLNSFPVFSRRKALAGYLEGLERSPPVAGGDDQEKEEEEEEEEEDSADVAAFIPESKHTWISFSESPINLAAEMTSLKRCDTFVTASLDFVFIVVVPRDDIE
jgi:hypothetical protein